MREEEYMFVKDLLSRIRGLPSSVQVVRRERRLIAHGTIQRVHTSERTKTLLEDSRHGTISGVKHRQFGNVEIQQSQHAMPKRRRANSLDSCLSDATSMSSISSANSLSSLNGETRHLDSRAAAGMHRTNRGNTFSERFTTRENTTGRTRITQLYAFIFNDLAIFANLSPSRSSSGKCRESLELLTDTGICRILSLTDYSGNLGSWKGTSTVSLSLSLILCCLK